MELLEVGSTVNWRGGFGKSNPIKAKVLKIEVNCFGRIGQIVPSVEWGLVNSKNVIVDLDNGTWAYGHQLDK
jgi:hypothetical protein